MVHPHRPARIGFLLSQLGVRATDIFAEQIRELGITPSEAGVIRIIGRSAGISQRDLAVKLGTVQSRVVSIIDRLESAGLAGRTRSTTDRRIQQLELTEEGRAILLSLRAAAEAQEAIIATGLTAGQREQLYELLSTLGTLHGLDADVHSGYQPSSGKSREEPTVD